MWQRLTGGLPTAFTTRVRPPANFGFPPEPDDADSTTVAAMARQPMHPVQLGFLFAVGVGLALLGYYLLTNVGQLLIWIAVALFIALGLDPIVRFFERRGAKRAVGVLITMALALAVLGGFFATIIPQIASQTSSFIDKAPGFVDSFLHSEFFMNIDKQFHVSQRLQTEIGKFFSDSGAVGGIFGGVLGVGSVIAQSMFGTLTITVLAIYFLASMPSIKSFAYRLAPRSSRHRVQVLAEEITNSVGNYVMGQAFVALLNATYAFIVMTIVGVPFSVLLSLVVALLAFVPLVGAVIAGILVSLIALTVGWQTAVIYAICYFAYLQFEAYFVSPRVMQKAVAVPGAVAVISVIAGGTLLGIAGALMAIPMAAAVMLLLREVFITRQDQR
ncbi:AI-2E family transporter [Paeniglutamicibacter cryotolerans]